MIDDKTFLDTLNGISRTQGVGLPLLQEGESPSSEFLDVWGRFLESCVKQGISLSDPRWQRVTAARKGGRTRFGLEGPTDTPDPDFRVGLQLLMGILGDDADTDRP